MREKVFNIRFSDEEWERLERLTAHLGLNAAGLIRMVLMEKERALGLVPAGSPAKKTAKKR